MAQSNDKVGQPKEHENIENLKDDEVLVVGSLTTIEGKEAMCSWAQLRDIGSTEGLKEGRKLLFVKVPFKRLT